MLLLMVLQVGAFAPAGFNHAWAQQDDVETAIEQSRPSAATKALRAQTAQEPPKTNDPQELSVFHHKRGMAFNRLGDYARAIEDLRLALTTNQSNRLTPDDWGSRWRIQDDLGGALGGRGLLVSALEHWNAVAREYDNNNGYIFFIAKRQVAGLSLALADRSAADGARLEAHQAISKIRGDQYWGRWGSNLMRALSSLEAQFTTEQGKHAETEGFRKQELEYAEKALAIARNAHSAGHQSIRIELSNVSAAKIALAGVLATRAKYGEAESVARSDLESRLSLYGYNTTSVSYMLAVLGRIRLQQGDATGAEKFYRHSVTAIAGGSVAPHSTALADRRRELAHALLVQSRWTEAAKVFEERGEGLRSDAEQFKRVGSRAGGWALALQKVGQSQQSVVMAERLIANQLKRSVQNTYTIATYRGILGMAKAQLGGTQEALTAFQEAIPELLRRDQDGDPGEYSGHWRTFWQRIVLEGYLELLAKLNASAETPPGLDVADESFRIADSARRSSVQEAIGAASARAQIPDPGLAELARKEQDTLNRIRALTQLLTRLASASEQERLVKVIADMRAEIERLRKEYTALRADIRKRYPEYAELIDPRPTGLADVRKALAPGEALVSMYLGETQSYVWTIGTDGKTAFRVVPVTRVEIENDVGELRKALDLSAGSVARLRPFDLTRAHKLYRTFFEPDEALWKDAQVLNIIPHGAFDQLPMALLLTAASPVAEAGKTTYADAPWLIRKVAVAQLPSASAFTALRRMPAGKAARQSFIGFGDPVFSADASAGVQRGMVRKLDVRKVADPTDEQLNAAMRGGRQTARTIATEPQGLSHAFRLMSALPDTSDELKEIAATLKADVGRDVFVSTQATEKNVKQTVLDNRRVVAFATHGIAPGEVLGLDQPALVLSNPALTGDSENDGFLTMEEVLGLKLDADWVVLSACNTASADGRSSEAVSGLGRAFFFAGARSLLVSNWAVETTSARLLTTEIFKRQSENAALTRAQALRESMLALMGKHATDAAGRATFSYAHPVFWAPFTLVGDGGR
jgi:CHAT domain-containing protein